MSESKLRNKDYQRLVKEHYRKEAKAHGLALTATMHDALTRRAEIDAILSHLRTGDKCLEVGCGNGSASIEIATAKKLSMRCIDFSPELIALACKQKTNGVKGTISFRQQDILTLDERARYDVVFTERCIINLLEWRDQKEALRRMAKALKKGGRLVLVEAFADGLRELNRARSEVGLTEIHPAYHNLHLEKEKVQEHLVSQGLKLTEENNFLSSYYFGSRVIYPVLAKAAKKQVMYNNAFGNFFFSLPPAGNYSHIKLLAFSKR